MYKIEELTKYPYFNDLLKTTEIENVVDSLTGVINRSHFIEFIHTLIDSKQEFILGLMDLDNFKNINDSYGHHSGDVVLIDIAESLRLAILEHGLVGRFGGDEFLFIYTKDVNYDGVHNLFDTLYDDNVFRRNIKLDTTSVFVTATCGSACFPKDANDYEELFKKADKTLYRGKSKGRNCFIIYVEEKHKDIDVNRLISTDSFTLLHNLYDKFSCDHTIEEKIRNCSVYFKDSKKSGIIYFVNQNNEMINTENGEKICDIDLTKLTRRHITYMCTNIEELNNEEYSYIYEPFHKLKILSLMILKIKRKHEIYGYLIFTEDKINRIWQVEDESIAFFFASLIAEYEFYNKKK